MHLAHAFDPQHAVSVSQVDPPPPGQDDHAGLLIGEPVQWGAMHQMLMLCPKARTYKWRREMWDGFRERFTMLTGDVIAGAFGQNAWTEQRGVVASVDLTVQDHILPGLQWAT